MSVLRFVLVAFAATVILAGPASEACAAGVKADCAMPSATLDDPGCCGTSTGEAKCLDACSGWSACATGGMLLTLRPDASSAPSEGARASEVTEVRPPDTAPPKSISA